ncbi:glycogen debranching N-terminal domain-containing protein [Streptomyces sp. NPDC003247]|uniref:glycogen debranching N-terminal domain-containing protein n=1 Tax=Streptomyces sp. NPDC003247 TaxID=3364677 RepID=UPI0036B4D2E9
MCSRAQSELMLERRRHVGEGMREDLRLRNLSTRPMTVPVSLRVGADFADLFAVKEGPRTRGGQDQHTGEGLGFVLLCGSSSPGRRREPRSPGAAGT